MRGDEGRVVAAFCAWLAEDGWSVRTGVAHVDVLAVRGAERLYAEAKGRTASPGLDVDTMFGQLLRRMTNRDARYAVVVPEGRTLTAVLRVPLHVRARLGVGVYAVSDGGMVRLVDDRPHNQRRPEPMAKQPQDVTYRQLRLVDGSAPQGQWRMVPGGFVNEHGYSFVPMTAVVEAQSETARTMIAEERTVMEPEPCPDDDVDLGPVWRPSE